MGSNGRLPSPLSPRPAHCDLGVSGRILITVQAFRAWTNHKLSVRKWKPAEYLEDVFEDGFTLITLLEILSGKVRYPLCVSAMVPLPKRPCICPPSPNGSARAPPPSLTVCNCCPSPALTSFSPRGCPHSPDLSLSALHFDAHVPTFEFPPPSADAACLGRRSRRSEDHQEPLHAHSKDRQQQLQLRVHEEGGCGMIHLLMRFPRNSSILLT